MKKHLNTNINPIVMIYIIIIFTPICMYMAYVWSAANGHLTMQFIGDKEQCLYQQAVLNGENFTLPLKIVKEHCSPEQIVQYSYLYGAFIAGCASVSATMRYLPESFILRTMFSLDAALIIMTFFFFKTWLLELNKVSKKPYKNIARRASIIRRTGMIGGACFLVSNSMWSGINVYDIQLGPLNLGDWHAVLAYTFCSLCLLSSMYFTKVEYRLRKNSLTSMGYRICFVLRVLSFIIFIAIFTFVIISLIINKKLKILNSGLEYWMIHIFLIWYASFIFDRKFFSKLSNTN